MNNEIQVLPNSIYDDQIRVASARQIYGHPAFRRYANRALPPIHIVVDRGRVILKVARSLHNWKSSSPETLFAAGF